MSSGKVSQRLRAARPAPSPSFPKHRKIPSGVVPQSCVETTILTSLEWNTAGGVHIPSRSILTAIFAEPSCLLSSQVQNLSRYVLTPSMH